jgi:hypothetical protein
MIGRQEDKLRRLYETYLDKLGIAKTMRRNLASDIEAGYSLSSVVKQMVKIEEYEATTVRKSEEEYRSYQESLGITDGEFCAIKRKWDEPFCKTLKYCSVGNRI